MRKTLLTLIILILVVIGAGVLAWVNKRALLAHHLRSELNVGVKIGTFEIGKGNASVGQLWVGNPKGSRTTTAFSAQKIEMDGTWKQVMGNPMTIDEILIENIFVGIEQYSKGNDNNWGHILNQNHKTNPTSKDYLIKKLVIQNLTVQLMKPDGSVKTFPTINEMTFYNISSETGFPIKDIEKAIFQLMMKEIFRRFDLNQLLETIVPDGSPLKYVPFFTPK